MISKISIQNVEDLQIDQFVGCILTSFSNEIAEIKSEFEIIFFEKDTYSGVFENNGTSKRNINISKIDYEPPLEKECHCIKQSLINRLGFVIYEEFYN